MAERKNRPGDDDPDPGRLIHFPTALPELLAVTGQRRPGPIESWLMRGGRPEAFGAVRHRFDVRDEAAPGVCWGGLDLSDDDLGGFDLRGAYLVDCVLPDITAADLSGARLDRSVVLHARGTVFDEATLVEADGPFARLDAARFRGALMHDANLAGAGLRRAAFLGADLSGADLTDTDLTGSSIHLARSLEDCDLEGAFGLEPYQVAACIGLGARGLWQVRRAL
jgi:hypothetical protein